MFGLTKIEKELARLRERVSDLESQQQLKVPIVLDTGEQYDAVHVPVRELIKVLLTYLDVGVTYNYPRPPKYGLAPNRRA